MATATITLDNPTPKYGDKIIATVETDAPKAGAKMVVSQNGVQVAVSDIVYRDGPTWTEDFGLYAPSWPSGAAQARIDVIQQLTATSKGKKKRTTYPVIASIEFEVAA